MHSAGFFCFFVVPVGLDPTWLKPPISFLIGPSADEILGLVGFPGGK